MARAIPELTVTFERDSQRKISADLAVRPEPEAAACRNAERIILRCLLS
jgi:hypothetical protein